MNFDTDSSTPIDRLLTVVLAAALLAEVDGDAGDAAVMVMGLLWADQQCNGFPLSFDDPSYTLNYESIPDTYSA
eukprot:scaffold33638_cov142-Skeletonema_dohrnii-CCMP3373.AAC.9